LRATPNLASSLRCLGFENDWLLSNFMFAPPTFIIMSAAGKGGRHTIILVQKSGSKGSRMYMDFESVSAAMDGNPHAYCFVFCCCQHLSTFVRCMPNV
jgi:hypothetical protein